VLLVRAPRGATRCNAPSLDASIGFTVKFT